MKTDPDFANLKIAIWGLGLMGGSLAMALSGKCASLTGIDPDQETVSVAKASGIFNSVAQFPDDNFSQSDLIILAAPVRGILKQIMDLPRFHRGAIVLDLGSTKREIMEAMDSLPLTFNPIGGHPMCGTERTSFQNASGSLFENSTFALVSLPRTSANARELVEACVCLSGARPTWISADEHDQWTALTSHLPYLLACALAETIPAEAKAMVGPGLRSTTRLAAVSSSMMMDVMVTNKNYILESIAKYRKNLEKLEESLRSDEDDILANGLQQSKNAHTALFSGDLL